MFAEVWRVVSHLGPVLHEESLRAPGVGVAPRLGNVAVRPLHAAVQNLVLGLAVVPRLEGVDLGVRRRPLDATLAAAPFQTLFPAAETSAANLADWRLLVGKAADSFASLALHVGV